MDERNACRIFLCSILFLSFHLLLMDTHKIAGVFHWSELIQMCLGILSIFAPSCVF